MPKHKVSLHRETFAKTVKQEVSGAVSDSSPFKVLREYSFAWDSVCFASPVHITTETDVSTSTYTYFEDEKVWHPQPHSSGELARP